MSTEVQGKFVSICLCSFKIKVKLTAMNHVILVQMRHSSEQLLDNYNSIVFGETSILIDTANNFLVDFPTCALFCDNMNVLRILIAIYHLDDVLVVYLGEHKYLTLQILQCSDLGLFYTLNCEWFASGAMRTFSDGAISAAAEDDWRDAIIHVDVRVLTSDGVVAIKAPEACTWKGRGYAALRVPSFHMQCRIGFFDLQIRTLWLVTTPPPTNVHAQMKMSYSLYELGVSSRSEKWIQLAMNIYTYQELIGAWVVALDSLLSVIFYEGAGGKWGFFFIFPHRKVRRLFVYCGANPFYSQNLKMKKPL
jgi:hypothetical protein